MQKSEREELRHLLLDVMNIRVFGEGKECDYKQREQMLYAIGKEFGLDEEATRYEMLKIRVEQDGGI